jgi:biopolymer transport protein ExbB
MPLLDAPLTVGADGEETPAHGLIGAIDELRLSDKARDATWIGFAEAGSSAGGSTVAYGADDTREAESGGTESYFMVTLRNVTVDGWVVIGVLAVMSAISWLVMVSKGMVINRVRKDNRRFLEAFRKLAVTDIDNLDAAGDDAFSADDSPLLTALAGDHGHYVSSTLYRLYHAGVQEMHQRTPRTVGAAGAPLRLSVPAVNAIKATMDGSLVRELQQLNGQMVLLTIAISGGPFLGLLGTVVGVMITFAAIAATGDVNVNSIAPGIAAALVATVAGLAVAIPALFGYNYLGTRIKEISADMHVFVDEFVAKIAEQHS